MHLPSLHRFRPLAALLATTFLSNSLYAIPARILAWDSEIAARPLAIGDARTNTKIEGMFPTQRTKSYQINEGKTPSSIVSLDKKDSDGNPLTCPIKIADGIKEPLLIILPDLKAPTGIRIYVMEDDSTGFTWGTTRFINAMTKELIFGYEKKGVALPPSWTPVQIAPGGESRNMDVKIFFRDQPQQPIYTAVWEQNSNVRSLIFLLPSDDPRIGPVATKVITEDQRIIKLNKEMAEKAAKEH